jgi:hypothetical protein
MPKDITDPIIYMLQAGTFPAKGHPIQLKEYISATVKAGTPQKSTVGNRGHLLMRARLVRLARISNIMVLMRPTLIFDGMYFDPGNPWARMAITTSHTSIGRAAGRKVTSINPGLGIQKTTYEITAIKMSWEIPVTTGCLFTVSPPSIFYYFT